MTRTPEAVAAPTSAQSPVATSAETYRHSQVGKPMAVGTLLLALLATLLVTGLSAATIKAVPWLVVALYAVVGLGYALFYRLTVTVGETSVRAAFGVGFFAKEVALRNIVATEIITTRWRWGWGIHWTPVGWLYNVGGRRAVRLILQGERPVMIGSDQPEALMAAIDAARGT